MFPFESTQETISTTFLSGIVILLNFSGEPTVKVLVFVSPLIAFTFLVKVNSVANPFTSVSLTTGFLFSWDDALTVKSTISRVSKIILESVVEVILKPLSIIWAWL